jgi:beta-glucosidase-like glycosyl hydrolase
LAVKTPLKHYPFKPGSKSEWSKSPLSKSQVLDKLAIFKTLGKRSDFILATNAFNPQIDSKKIATLSREWIGLLKRDLGYKGLVIADSIATLRSSDESLRELSKG